MQLQSSSTSTDGSSYHTAAALGLGFNSKLEEQLLSMLAGASLLVTTRCCTKNKFRGYLAE
jgi:hypothetical protein